MKINCGKILKKCLFPVAGLGTRFLPATKDIPKEMVPLIDRPLIHYGVDEAVSSGCEEILLVSGRGKQSIEDYFDRSPELEKALEAKGKRELLDLVKAVGKMAKVISVRQPEPLGLGHAVLCGEPVCGDAPFGVVLPDDVMIAAAGDPPVLAQLIQVHEKRGGIVVALEKVPRQETSRYGIVDVEETNDPRLFKIRNLVEKPVPEDAPSDYAIMGRYVLTPGIFDHIKNTERGAGGEYQLTDAMKAAIGDEPIWGYVYSGRRYDCGTRESWLRATIAIAARDEQLRAIIEEELENSR
ncbi:MAG: UTP--glucose-1-phosphate uridylyltransferase GalU [Thermovirgaceae bacterium]